MLKRNLEEMESLLTERHYEMLENPRTLQHDADEWLKDFIIVRHYVAKYELQVYAYGPFRTQQQENEVKDDNARKEREFPINKHGAFHNFLEEVRFHLWMMEDDMITNRDRGFSPYWRKEI